MPKHEPVKPEKVREARQFLRKKKMQDVFSPRAFAAAAAETGQDFDATLRYLAHLQMGGQGEGEFSETAQTLKDVAAAGAPRITINNGAAAR